MIGANLYGTGYNKRYQDAFPRILDALRSIGIRAIRYWIYGQNNDGSGVIKAKDSYDFSYVARDLRAIRNAGMYAYANWGKVPAFMSEGLPAYHQFESWVSDPNTSDADLVWAGPDGSRWRLATATERPYVWLPNIPHINGAQVYDFGLALASECSNLIDWIGSWNEPGGRATWPPVQAPPYAAAYERLFDEVLAPFARGYRGGCTGGVATFVGPEADVGSAIGFLCDLEIENEYRVFDVLSFHPYPWQEDFLTGALTRTEEFMTTARQCAEGRPIWSTEVIDEKDNGQVPELFRESERLYPDLRAQFVFNPEQLFVGGPNGGRLKDGFEFKLSAQGEKWKAWVEGRPGKRRAVRP